MAKPKTAVTEEPTTAVFRVYPQGDVVALLPLERATTDGRYIVCYQHIGQHGAADYMGVVADTRAATAEEYTPLKREMESLGYTLKVAKRAPAWSKVRAAMRKVSL